MPDRKPIPTENLDYLEVFAHYLIYVWAVLAFCTICYSTAKRIHEIMKIRESHLSCLQCIALRFQRSMHSSLAYYCSDKPWIQYLQWGSFWFNTTIAFPISILGLNNLVLSIIAGDSELYRIPLPHLIVGGIFHILYFLQHCFFLQLIRKKQEYLHIRPDASIRSDFTIAERNMIVRTSMIRAYKMLIVAILIMVIPMIPEFVQGCQFVFTRKMILYVILMFAIMTFYALQTKKYLKYESKYLTYKAECSKIEMKAAAVASFLKDYNPRLIIRTYHKEEPELDGKEFGIRLLKRIPKYLMKLEEHISIIENQCYKPLPRNTKEITVVPRVYLYLVLAFVADFGITTITFLLEEIPREFFMVSVALNYMVVILALPIVMSLMNYSKFMFGELPHENHSIESELLYRSAAGISQRLLLSVNG